MQQDFRLNMQELYLMLGLDYTSIKDPNNIDIIIQDKTSKTILSKILLSDLWEGLIRLPANLKDIEDNN